MESGPTFVRKSMRTVNPVNMSSVLFRRSAIESASFQVEDGVLSDAVCACGWLRVPKGRLVRRSASFEPSLLRLPRTHRIMLASLAGARGRGVVRRLLRLPPSPTGPA